MKSFLASVLTVGLAIADSRYYIGNFTVSGEVNGAIPYPLDTCLPTGALSPFTYSIFSCNGTTMVNQYIYAQTDKTCSGAYTLSQLPIKVNPGYEGYANCVGPRSYMEINQYLASCNSWEQGKEGSAKTFIAADACAFQGVTQGVPIYSRTTCDGEGQLTKLYAGDPFCTTVQAIIDLVSTPLGCGFFRKEGDLEISSAMLKCVVDDEVQRCAMPLVNYAASIHLENQTDVPDYNQVYSELYQYAGVNVIEIGAYDIILNLSFCTQYEDSRYEASLESLGATTVSSSWIDDVATVCWTCKNFECWNLTSCATDDYCTMTEKCYPEPTTTMATENPETTEEAKSATIVRVSIALMGLLLSLALL